MEGSELLYRLESDVVAAAGSEEIRAGGVVRCFNPAGTVILG